MLGTDRKRSRFKRAVTSIPFLTPRPPKSKTTPMRFETGETSNQLLSPGKKKKKKKRIKKTKGIK
jgi:hypothetical protein